MFPTTTSLVVFSSVSVGGGWIFQSAGLLISSASQLSQTPLPAALPLFVTGLGALGLLGWRRKRKQAARSNFVFDVGRIAVKFRRWKAAAICGALALSFSASSGSAATYGFGPGVNYLTFSRPGTAGELVFATGGLFAIYAPSAHFPDDGLGALASSGITLLDSGGQTIYVLSGIAHVFSIKEVSVPLTNLGDFTASKMLLLWWCHCKCKLSATQRTLFRWVHL